MSRLQSVKCKSSGKNEEISIEHCEYIRHDAFCKDCAKNKDGRKVSKYQQSKEESCYDKQSNNQKS